VEFRPHRQNNNTTTSRLYERGVKTASKWHHDYVIIPCVIFTYPRTSCYHPATGPSDLEVLFHEQWAALLEMEEFPRACPAVLCYVMLVYPQRYCQGHGAANAASREASVFPRLVGALPCRAGRWELLWTVVLFPRRAVSRAALSGTLLCCSHLVWNFLKMSKQLTPDSFDTVLFVTEMEQLPAIWDSRFSSYRNKQEKIYAS